MSLRRTSHKNRIYLQTSSVAGIPFHHTHEIWYLLQPEDVLTLRREPDNPHDANAIEVFWGETKLGYVPRAENTILARMMDKGRQVTAILTEVNLIADYYEPVVELTMEIWTTIQLPNDAGTDSEQSPKRLA